MFFEALQTFYRRVLRIRWIAQNKNFRCVWVKAVRTGLVLQEDSIYDISLEIFADHKYDTAKTYQFINKETVKLINKKIQEDPVKTDNFCYKILDPVEFENVIIEPIEGAVSFTQKSKARHESNLAEKRLVEAEKLASEGKLDVNTENKINNLISKHTNALNRAIDKIDISKLPEDIQTHIKEKEEELNNNMLVNGKAKEYIDNLIKIPFGKYKNENIFSFIGELIEKINVINSTSNNKLLKSIKIVLLK